MKQSVLRKDTQVYKSQPHGIGFVAIENIVYVNSLEMAVFQLLLLELYIVCFCQYNKRK